LDSSGSGTTSGLIAAIDWVVGQVKAKQSAQKIISVINLSLTGPAQDLLDNAIASATSQGVVVVAASGNDAQNACNFSPGRSTSAITVAASDSSDNFATFSNWGSCVDVIAPGVGIISSSRSSDSSIMMRSGTSMAAPHVAGVVALALANHSFTTTQAVTDYIKSVTTSGKIKGSLQGTLNLLINNIFV
jgi:subtilisin family serine protease